MWVSNDFIYFPIGTFGTADIPAFDPNDYYYKVSRASCLTAPTEVMSCYLLVWADGSALIGSSTYADPFAPGGPYVSMSIFNAALIGSAFKVDVQEASWMTTFSSGPAINIALANFNTTAPTTAQLFGARYRSLRGITPEVSTPTPTTFVR